MASKARQETFDVFKQKKVAAIEKWADVFNEKRDLIAGLKVEQKNAKMKLKEAIHKAQADLDRQENAKGEPLLVYIRGDYRVTLKTVEEIGVKIGEESKDVDNEPTGDDDHDEEDTDLEVEVQK